MIKGVPYDAEIAFLESSGTEWIDTGVSATGATNSEFQFKMSVAGFAFGARTAWNASAYSLNFATGNYAFNYGNNGVVATLTTNIPVDTNWHTAKIQSGGALSLDEWTSTAGTYSFTTNGSLILFGTRQGSSLNLTASGFKYCKIWQSSTLVRDYIPVRVGQVGYLYDRVTRRLFGNAGTGAFTLGPDVATPVMSLHRMAFRRPYKCELEYIESLGVFSAGNAQRIVDDLPFDGRYDAVEVTCAITDTKNYGTVLGINERNAEIVEKRLTARRNGTSATWQFQGPTGLDIAMELNKIYTFRIGGAGNGGSFINDTIGMFADASSYVFTKPIYLFCVNDFSGINFPCAMKLYRYRHYRNNVLVRDFIPVLDWDGVACMYDRVTGRRFYNAGKGDFVAGPEIHEVEYIESSGTQYINAGLDYFPDFDVAIDIPNGERNVTIHCDGTHLLERIGAATPYWQISAGDTLQSTVSVYGYHRVQFESSALTIDGQAIGTINNRTWAEGKVCYIGYNGYNIYVYKLYFCKMWDELGALARDFIPIRVGSGTTWTGALLDTVNHKVYRNAGTGAFVIGPDKPGGAS